MKKIYIILLIFSCTISEFKAQIVINDGFESGTFNPLISFQTVGTYTSSPGIINNTNFGSTKAFSFGRSTCGSSCFNNYKTTLTITFPTPTYVDSIKWEEMEIYNNWGSQGQVFLDNVVLTSASLGALPINSHIPDATPRSKAYSINQTVTTIKLEVNDITNSSEIIIDDLQIFYKVTSKIAGFQYWFDNDFANNTSTTVSPVNQLNINNNIPTTGLSTGIHIFNFRSWDDSSRYSSIVSHFFYKTSVSETNPNPKIVAYEYWPDNDYASAVLVNTSLQQQVNINELISMSSLNTGIHNFNIRFKDNTDLWSSVVSHFFYKNPKQIVTLNTIKEYRYWFDNDFANAVNLSITPNQQINLIDNLDLTRLPKGNHEINFQFKDTLGMWSVVIVDTIQKLSLPIADFTYAITPTCDSTIISFTDKSIDGDTYFWDFGDGNNDSIAYSSHTFFIPGSYIVSLTVTDTTTLADSTKQITVNVSGNTSVSITETACDSYLSPSGNYTWTSSGVYNDTISNQSGCDSLFTINLSINNSTSSTDIITACDSYTWMDGNTYTSNNNTATHTLTNINGCDSVVTLDLTINTVDVSVTQNGVTLSANATGATYQWLDCNNENSELNGNTNQSFTATENGNFAAQITQNGCVDTSVCYAVTTVGILKNTFDFDITVFPNPTDGLVKINLGETLNDFTVILTDMSGKIISQLTYQNTDMFQMNLNAQSGIFLLNIISGNKKAIVRLIKN